MKQNNKDNSSSGKSPVDGIKNEKELKEQKELKDNLDKIKHKIVVLSGKGGVGKSTVAVNLAVSLANKGSKVGLLDIDIHGPSIPKMLGIEKEELVGDGEKLIPIDYKGALKVVSIGFLMKDSDDPVIWRGPLKYGVIKQFLKDVLWGELDYLIIDSPPGTGDEPLSICQLIDKAAGAVVVTTPQDVALIDVRKSINFCHKLNIPVIGVIENMSGFTCPHCGKSVNIFKTGGGKRMSEDMNVPFLGNIPIDATITEGGDSGNPVVSGNSDAELENYFSNIIDNIIKNIK